ncbi:hypothetical protein NHP200010_12200 [Helicobacter bizzozeronii]|uniref:hypothetical protein n=1 Tax=Helicobacter bizzozeronii TaxID=56877 RepID=UPI00244D9456|nr:hypothetical protein [Helicobacter bizzozeronii]GMB93499.1 hypothetical protein NHP200010_12200 [Helicobacter bizzozeronii]
MSSQNSLSVRIQKFLKRSFKWIKQRLVGGIEYNLECVEYKVVASNTISSCVPNQKHQELLYAVISIHGVEPRVVVDSRPSCVEMMDAYLNWVRPVAMPHLIRVGGNRDCGYVMFPPPPPF